MALENRHQSFTAVVDTMRTNGMRFVGLPVFAAHMLQILRAV